MYHKLKNKKKHLSNFETTVIKHLTTNYLFLYLCHSQTISLKDNNVITKKKQAFKLETLQTITFDF